MNLQDAQLCIECEWIYASSRTCPRCGSGVGYPVARALDRELHSVAHLARPKPVPALATAAASAVRDELEPRRIRFAGTRRTS